MTKFCHKFWKFNGAGNDFALFNEAPPSTPAKRDALIKKLCARHSGIGADGLVFIFKKNSHPFWRFFNADGSETHLCGNAARCVAHYLSIKAPKKKEWTWEGKLGRFRGRRRKGFFEVSWPLISPKIQEARPELLEDLRGFNDRGLAAAFEIQVGVPHLVLLNYEVWNPPDRVANSAYLRAHPSLGPEGCNVTWLSLKNSEAVTFERGVENETLACGSGAVAAFLAQNQYELQNSSAQTYKSAKSREFKFPGGVLRVSVDTEENFWLAGPTDYVFEGILK